MGAVNDENDRVIERLRGFRRYVWLEQLALVTPAAREDRYLTDTEQRLHWAFSGVIRELDGLIKTLANPVMSEFWTGAPEPEQEVVSDGRE
jgi:hypothetical protein